MGRIRTLPPHVVNQIAAGEVIERPASVVKELVENALDAGATRIEVRLVEGGKARIEVRDDGVGMDAADLASAFLPHATSKLSEVADLEHIASLGFRGEALASIGSVSRTSITSRERGASSGSSVEDRDGAVSAVKPAAAAPGTVIVVEGLFASVPARRKFLRSPSTELGHVQDTMIRFGLAHQDVAFHLEHEGRVLLVTAAGEGRRARIGRFHGDDLAGALLSARSPDGSDLTVEAYLSPPGLSRADARLQQTFLNGRFLRDKTVTHALREAYRDLVPPGGRQPIVFVFLACDPARVDVNVHPTKSEVRWRDPSLVHETVRRTLRAALEGARPGVPVLVGAGAGRAGDPFASLVASTEHAFTNGVGERLGVLRPAGAFGLPSEVGHRHDHLPGETCAESGPAGHGAPATIATEPEAGPGAEARPPERLRPVGQVLGTYLVLEAPDGLVLIDQHALHERVLFDRINARLQRGALEMQHLLVPVVVHLGAAEVARVEEERALFESLGWEVEPFGPDAVAVQAVPAVLRRPDPEGMLREVLGLLESGRREGLDRVALLSSVVDRLACRAAVMAGDALHPDEVLALLAQAETLNHAHSCPHGRPTRLRLSRHDLERYFHRIQ